jgi:hypothetical protein
MSRRGAQRTGPCLIRKDLKFLDRIHRPRRKHRLREPLLARLLRRMTRPKLGNNRHRERGRSLLRAAAIREIIAAAEVDSRRAAETMWEADRAEAADSWEGA